MTAQELWCRVFGDTPSEMERYCAALSLHEHCFPVYEGGELRAAAYWYDCGELVLPDGKALPAGVLYAVASVPEKRGKGFGKRAARLAWEDMQARGRFPLTVPAEKSLFSYYQKTLGAVDSFSVCRRELTDGDIATPVSVDAAEYGALREHFLADRLHVRFSLPCLKLQETRGGFYRVSDGCFAVEKRDDRIFVPEALGNIAEVEGALRTLSEDHPVTLLTPAESTDEGCPFAMSAPLLQIPGNAGWFGFPFD